MSRSLFASGRRGVERPRTLGGGQAHLFVTRAATLQFQVLTRLPFEEARRELSHLLLHAAPLGGRRWSIFLPEHGSLVAYVVQEGGLLLVGSVALAEDAPDAHIPGPLDAGSDE